MNSLFWICLVLAAWPSAFALYFTKLKEVFRPPSGLRNDSYFGYSITYDEYYKTLVISAPRADNIGQVYDCNIDKQTCTAITRNITRVSEKYEHDYWFGATVKAGRDFVLMCAPRYTEHTTRKSNGEGFDAYVTHGICYKHAEGKLTRKRIIDNAVRLEDSPSPMEATMDSFGWSIDVAGDDSIIVGGPGMFHGRAMVYNRPEIYNKPPNLIRHSSRVTPEFNFGYAVASGVFFNNYTSYAVGSPNGFGEVLFYKVVTFLRKLDKKVDTRQIGSMFGSVLCAAKMFGQRTDLIVGAPAYGTLKTYNKGAVYVYLATSLKKPPIYKRTIVGEASGSMFGSAIINVGDLNGDRKHEIAIGAPFEKDQGVVYLYSGADLISDKVIVEPLQKIKPEASYGKSFGMSLTPLLDYDGNGCKEIAIGSPYTDTVLLLRCMASVVVKTLTTFPNLQGRTSSGKTNFEFEVCLSVQYPSLPVKITALLSTTVEMNHDYAKLLNTNRMGGFSFNTSLDDKKPEYCKYIPFNLPLEGKYHMVIGLTISSELLYDPRTLKDFDSSRVILSDRSILKNKNWLWAAECAGNLTCVPELTLTPYISFQNYPYVIGSSNKETMRFTISNHGEVAYESCLRVLIVGANVLKPGGCVYESTDEGNRINCEPTKPLFKDETWTTGEIELEMNHLTNLNKMINITMSLYNHCNDNRTLNKLMSIPVIADPSGIVAKGETDIGNVIDMTEVDIKENGKKFKQIYTIRNNGPTNWMGLQVEVTLQMYPYISYQKSAVTVYYSTTNVYILCSLTSQDKERMTYLCQVESLMTKVEFAKILIPMEVVNGTLEGLLDKNKNVTVMSSIKMQLTDGEHRTQRLITTISFQEATVPIETIIIAVIVALCILIIIALILYRVGFLRRKRREELQKLRKSIRRQTVLRRTTMPTQSPAATDRRQILDGMVEEDEHGRSHDDGMP